MPPPAAAEQCLACSDGSDARPIRGVTSTSWLSNRQRTRVPLPCRTVADRADSNTYPVVQVGDAALSFQDPGSLELDALRTETVEEAPPSAE